MCNHIDDKTLCNPVAQIRLSCEGVGEGLDGSLSVLADVVEKIENYLTTNVTFSDTASGKLSEPR